MFRDNFPDLHQAVIKSATYPLDFGSDAVASLIRFEFKAMATTPEITANPTMFHL
jgi:hypothetical protein